MPTTTKQYELEGQLLEACSCNTPLPLLDRRRSRPWLLQEFSRVPLPTWPGQRGRCVRTNAGQDRLHPWKRFGRQLASSNLPGRKIVSGATKGSARCHYRRAGRSLSGSCQTRGRKPGCSCRTNRLSNPRGTRLNQDRRGNGNWLHGDALTTHPYWGIETNLLTFILHGWS